MTQITDEEYEILLIPLSNLSFCIGYLSTDEYLAKKLKEFEENIIKADKTIFAIRRRQ